MASSGDKTCVLAIDLGSSGPKVALISEAGELLGRTSGVISTRFTADGGGEQDPDEWWRVITDCVRQLLAQKLVPLERVVAVSCASQWSVTVPVDEHGRHLMNAVHWTDTRGAVYTHKITDGLIKVSGYGIRRLARWVRLTGGAPTHSGADALAHILFIRHERPDIYRRTFKFLEPMDYLNFRLTGRAAASYATIFPYLLTDNRDFARIDYDARLIAWCGLDRAKLPDLLPAGTVLGPLLPAAADAWGLAHGTQVVGGTPDSHAAALGSGAVRDYEGHVCIGTTAWLSCHVPFKKTNLLDYLATMPSAIHGRNMVSAEQGAAGKCLDVFVHNWPLRQVRHSRLSSTHQAFNRSCSAVRIFARESPRAYAVGQQEQRASGRVRRSSTCWQTQSGTGPAPADVYQDLERIVARVAPGSDGLLFLPWLNGAGPPSGDSTMRGGFLNQSLRTGRATGRARDHGGGGIQPSLARDAGRTVRRPAVREAQFHWRMRPLAALVPDSGRHCGSPDPPDCRSPNGDLARRRDGCASRVGSHAPRRAPLAGADSKHVYPRSPAPRGVRPTVRRVRQQL